MTRRRSASVAAFHGLADHAARKELEQMSMRIFGRCPPSTPPLVRNGEKDIWSRRTLAVMVAAAIGLSISGSVPVSAQEPDWDLVRPGNTGIPGEEIRVVRFSADGDMWVAARWPFWREGGVGVYDRASNTWTTYANCPDYLRCPDETPLPSEFVNDIELTPDGIAWIATERGLVKKDGETWTIYSSANTPLTTSDIRRIERDSEGHVWITVWGSPAIWEFDGATWRSIDLPNMSQPNSLYVDAADHVWVTYESLNGVAEYDGNGWTFHGLAVARFKHVTGDLDGNLWLISWGLAYDFYKYDGATFTVYNSNNTPFAETTITTMGLDDTGDLFVGNWMGQVIKTTDAGTTWSLFAVESSRIHAIAPDPMSEDVWLANSWTVSRYAANGDRLRGYNTFNTGMPWYTIDNMSTDRDGNFWIATGEAGLSRFDGQRWRNWGMYNAGSEPYPFGGNEPMGGAYQDRDGVVWMGGNGIARWDPATGEFTGFWNWENNPGMGVAMFTHFAEDTSGTLFAVHEGGQIFRFNGSLWLVEPELPFGNYGVDTDRQGNIWICAQFRLHRWDGVSWTTVGDDWGIFDLGGATAMTIGPDDVIWVGTNAGLLRWDGIDLTLYDNSNSPLPALQVQGVAVRDDGMMAVSALEFNPWPPFPNGVAVIDGDIDDPGRWSVYRYEDSPLPHYQLGKVAFDAAGDLWISAISEAAAVLRLGSTSAGVEDPEASAVRIPLTLASATPNPFNPSTMLRYSLPATGQVHLRIFDVTGRILRTLIHGRIPSGEHGVRWDGRDEAGRRLPSGVYFARLESAGQVQSMKLVIAR